MKKSLLAATIRQALTDEGASISKHIDSVQREGRYKGIESTFEAAFLRALGEFPNAPRLKVGDIGATNRFPGREGGFVDHVIRDRDKAVTAFEFKAIRMPRKKSWGKKGVRFDQYQLVCDYLRLRDAKSCQSGWVVAFVYGPLVRDADTGGELFRMFHNQMATDTWLGDSVDPLSDKIEFKGKGRANIRRSYEQALDELGWREFCATSARPDNVVAVKPCDSDLGAICYRAL